MENSLRAVWERRYFLFSLVWLDLKTRYRRSILGLGWCLLHPLAMALILTAVFHSIFKADCASFLPFLLTGLAFWGYVSTVTLQGCHCFTQGQAYLRQFPTPLAIFPLRIALGTTVHLLATLAVAVVLGGFMLGSSSPLALLTLVPALALTLVLGWSLAVLAGLATVRVHDVEHLAQVGLQIVFYLTPILYPPGTMHGHPMAWVLDCNPLVPFLTLFREPILNGQPAPLEAFLAAAAAAVVMFLMAAAVLARVRRTLIFYL
jgi:lipopolysaccharide transport system permease protein